MLTTTNTVAGTPSVYSYPLSGQIPGFAAPMSPVNVGRPLGASRRRQIPWGGLPQPARSTWLRG